ncbi:MAG: hypothetical protein JXR96_01005 [Deltaproteobacteria bacterium]|nr:hypothetical protein [Deltaproteobacteria bacterium]
MEARTHGFDDWAQLQKEMGALRSASPREQYEAGQRAGVQTGCEGLADVLFAIQKSRLGRAALVEQSNSHAVFRISDCRCGWGQVGRGFAAGFISGALMSTGVYSHVRVEEVSCGEPPGCVCVFRAALVLKA